MSHQPTEDSASYHTLDTELSIEYRSYQEWRDLGRSVEGATAPYYRVNPDDPKQAVAVYGEDQTTPLERWDSAAWPLVPTDEHKASRVKERVKACWFPPRLGLWVHPDEAELKARMKKYKWRFRKPPHGAEPANRYWKDIGTADPMATIRAIEDLGIRVKLEKGFNGALVAAPPTKPAAELKAKAAAQEARAADVLRDMPTIGPVKLSESTGMDLPTAQAWLKEHRPAPVTRGPFGKPMPEQPKTSGLAQQRKAA